MGVSANDQKRPGDLRSFVQKRIADGVEFQSDPRLPHAQPMSARYPAIAASDGSSLSSSATESRTMQLALARYGTAASRHGPTPHCLSRPRRSFRQTGSTPPEGSA